MFQIELTSRVPIYDQIIRNVILFTENGVLKPHDKLPAVRTLAMELGVNPNTVAKAYKELEALGRTYSVAGKGSFINELPEGLNEAQTEALKQLKAAATAAYNEHISLSRVIEEIGKIYERGH